MRIVLVMIALSMTAYAGYESYRYHPYTNYNYYQNHPYFYKGFEFNHHYPYQYHWSQHRWYGPYFTPRYEGEQGKGMNPTYNYMENSNYDSTPRHQEGS